MATRKRSFKDIRKLIKKDLEQGERTVNQIASSTGLTWRTVNNHLIYLIGTAIVDPVYVSKYVKIYKLHEVRI